MRKLTAEHFLSIVWSLPLGNYVCESSKENIEFVNEILIGAKRKDIPCFTLNFRLYKDAEQAFLSNEGEVIASAIVEQCQKCIINFEHADVFSANDQYTFWLRTSLELERYTTGNIIPIFSLTLDSIESMFWDEEAPFYQSHCNL
jgi:hypothetical protein